MPKQIKRLYIGDNLPIMLGMESDSVDLIYTDPPFNTGTFRKGKTEKHSFIDTWSEYQVDFAYAYSLKMHHPKLWEMIALAEDMHSPAMRHYLEFMAPRIVQMHRLLKPTGSLYLHCDQNADAYLRMVMDCVFGKNNFRNEIAWCYETAGKPKREWARQHDSVLFYCKSTKNTFNPQALELPLSESFIQCHSRDDGDGRKYYIKTIGDKTYKYYLDEKGYKHPSDYWTDLFALGPRNPERTGYNSQKPLALVDRVIRASSNEGDLVMDPFCGCATTCISAAGLNRQWIGIDQNEDAIHIFRDRLTGDLLTYAFETNMPVDAKLQQPIELPKRKVAGYKKLSRAKAKIILLQRDYKAKRAPYCRGCLANKDEGDLNVDHILASANGGLDELENYQLLCTPCNSMKGDQDMEFLYRRLDERTAQKRMAVLNPQSKVPKK